MAKINKSLYKKAIEMVEEYRREEFKDEIMEVYEELLYESQIRKANKNTLIKLKKLYEAGKNYNIKGIGDAYKTHDYMDDLKSWIRKKVYHPLKVKEINRHFCPEIKIFI